MNQISFHLGFTASEHVTVFGPNLLFLCVLVYILHYNSVMPTSHLRAFMSPTAKGTELNLNNLYKMFSADKQLSVAAFYSINMYLVTQLTVISGSFHFCCTGIFSFDLQIFMPVKTKRGLETKV